MFIKYCVVVFSAVICLTKIINGEFVADCQQHKFEDLDEIFSLQINKDLIDFKNEARDMLNSKIDKELLKYAEGACDDVIKKFTFLKTNITAYIDKCPEKINLTTRATKSQTELAQLQSDMLQIKEDSANTIIGDQLLEKCTILQHTREMISQDLLYLSVDITNCVVQLEEGFLKNIKEIINYSKTCL